MPRPGCGRANGLAGRCDGAARIASAALRVGVGRRADPVGLMLDPQPDDHDIATGRRRPAERGGAPSPARSRRESGDADLGRVRAVIDALPRRSS